MFSILICSINKTFREQVEINIAQTIGHEYELIVWDNLANPKPITEVYNELAAIAKYPYLCFVHEDITFQTPNWSANLLQAFENNVSTGLIGVAGSKYKSKTPSGWSTGILKFDYCNIFHRDKNGYTQHLYNNPTNAVIEQVVNVDGVFMAIRREVWKDAKFNTDLLRGFHLYDIDFSMQVLKNWKNAVIFNIDIMHFTQGGDFGNTWLNYTILWHQKFADTLPVSVLAKKESINIEKKICKNWLYRLSTEKLSWKNKWDWLRTNNAFKQVFAWPYIAIFLFRRIR